MSKAKLILERLSRFDKPIAPIIAESADSWWLVKAGTKEIVNGPYDSKSDAEIELNHAPDGAKSSEVIQGKRVDDMVECSTEK